MAQLLSLKKLKSLGLNLSTYVNRKDNGRNNISHSLVNQNSVFFGMCGVLYMGVEMYATIYFHYDTAKKINEVYSKNLLENKI